MNYLLDTNTVIYYINNSLPNGAVELVESSIPAISFITRIELLAWPQLQIPEELKFSRFIEDANIYSCSESIILQTIAVKKQYKLKLPDAIIAATAIVNNLTLISRNLKDFDKVSDLQVIDPYML